MDELYDIKNLKIDYCHDGSAKVFLKTKIHRQVLCDIYGGKDGEFEGLLLVKLVNAIKEYMEERSWLTWGELPEETTACKMCPYLREIERDDYDYYYCFLTNEVMSEIDIGGIYPSCPLEESDEKK